MDLGNTRASNNNKTNLKANFRRKCQKRVDVAQKMAPGCPNLGPERGQNDGEMGHPGAYDKHRREKTNRRQDKFLNFGVRWLSCVDVAQK